MRAWGLGGVETWLACIMAFAANVKLQYAIVPAKDKTMKDKANYATVILALLNDDADSVSRRTSLCPDHGHATSHCPDHGHA